MAHHEGGLRQGADQQRQGLLRCARTARPPPSWARQSSTLVLGWWRPSRSTWTALPFPPQPCERRRQAGLLLEDARPLRRHLPGGHRRPRCQPPPREVHNGRPGHAQQPACAGDAARRGGQQQQHEGLAERADVHHAAAHDRHLVNKQNRCRIPLARMSDDVLRARCNRLGVQTESTVGIFKARDELTDLLIFRIVG